MLGFARLLLRLDVLAQGRINVRAKLERIITEPFDDVAIDADLDGIHSLWPNYPRIGPICVRHERRVGIAGSRALNILIGQRVDALLVQEMRQK